MNPTSSSGALPEAKQLLLKDIASKWPKFSETEIAALKNRDELVTGVQSKYSLDTSQAGREVDSVLKGREF
ncbi:MAG TPA: hypothetical protein VH867_06605 [Burkholderiales bacterium]|jgi:hypothetical protein